MLGVNGAARGRTAALLLAASLGVALAPTRAVGAPESSYVTVKKVSIRSAPQFAAPTVASAAFRDKLTVLARERDWLRVQYNGVAGWVHGSATAARAVSVSAKEAAAGVSADDVAFATKGFDATIEGEYRKGKTRTDFAEVDRMETLTVPEKALAEFREAGRLKAHGARP